MAQALLRIFVCYRREETRFAARALAQSIDQHLADVELFIDVDRRAIAIGENWKRRIESAIDSSDVVIAIIGDHWVDIADADGSRKLDNPDDPVRVELERALERDLLVVPVRLDEARMPRATELPDSISEFVFREGAELRHSRWDDDVRELIESLDHLRPELEKKRLAREEAARAAELERAERERVERERLEAGERERLAREQAEQVWLAEERAERERVARESAERLAREKADREQLARGQAEEVRLAEERADREREAQERAERERLAAEAAAVDRARQEQEQAERERLARETAERERHAREREETERRRLAAEAAERGLLERKEEKQRLADERKEQARRERERRSAVRASWWRPSRMALLAAPLVIVGLGAVAAVALLGDGADPPTPAPAVVKRPAISGTAKVGQILTVSRGTWSGTPTAFAFRWRRCERAQLRCPSINGANRREYRVKQSDVGRRLRVSVSTTNAGGSARALSAPTTIVPAPPKPPVNAGVPVVLGTAREGSTLTARTGRWNSSSRASFVFAWKRCNSSGGDCSEITGAGKRTYPLASADVGRTIRVEVTAANDVGRATASSAATGVVRRRPSPRPAPSPSASPGRLPGPAPAPCTPQRGPCLEIVGPNTSPSGGPVAGRAFITAFTVKLVRPGKARAQVKNGEIICSAKFAGITRTVRTVFQGWRTVAGRAGAYCYWDIPDTARGSIFEFEILIRAEGLRGSAAFRYRVG